MSAFSRRKYHPDRVSIRDIGKQSEVDSNGGDELVTLKERVKHVTWANFNLPLATGGLASLLASTPHQFRGLAIIGKIIFVFDLVVFVILVAAITARFIILPGSLKKSLLHPTEALFFPTSLLSVANIISCTQAYGVPACGPWLQTAVRVLFWIYAAVTFITAVAQYLDLFTAPSERLTIQSMMPAWILPVFPPMLVGTLASIITPHLSPAQRMPVLVAGVTFQGLGFSVAFFMTTLYIFRLTSYGIPAPNLRPGMFIAVGPPSFTGLALIGISNAIPHDYGYFAQNPMAAPALQAVALFMAIFLWTLGFWLFCIALLSVLAGARKMTFHLVWYALVFPNIGFTTTTTEIGLHLKSEGILWVASAMTILVVVTWLFVLTCQVRAVIRKDIMMPGKDEDKDQYKEDDWKHNVRSPA